MAFKFKFLKQNKDGSFTDFFLDYCQKASDITGLAIEIGINKIADVIAKCGFLVISNSSEVSDIEYTLNVKPNVNQNAVDFWKQAVYRTIRNPEGCVIVNFRNSGIYIADSWTTNEMVMKEKTYSNIVINVDGSTQKLNRVFKSSDIVHMRYSNPKLLKLLEAAGGNIDSLMAVVQSGIKAKCPKIKVTVNGQPRFIDQETGQPITTNQYAETIASKLSSDEIKSILTGSGIEVSAIDMKSTLTTTDINNLRDFIFGIVASALGIPKSILMGDTIAQSNEEFLTYACDPVVKIVNTAVCGAWISKEEYLSGDRIMLRSWVVKHVDLIDSADKIDKLLCNGIAWNEIYAELGRPTINEPWANMRRFTKNYAEEGGE